MKIKQVRNRFGGIYYKYFNDVGIQVTQDRYVEILRDKGMSGDDIANHINQQKGMKETQVEVTVLTDFNAIAWQDRTGKSQYVKDMGEDHILNALVTLKNNELAKERLVEQYPHLAASYANHMFNGKTDAQWIEIFALELEMRKERAIQKEIAEVQKQLEELQSREEKKAKLEQRLASLQGKLSLPSGQ